MPLRLTRSAGKHGIDGIDIAHAVNNAILDTYDIPPAHEPPRFLIIGPDRSGALLELIGIESDDGDDVVFHAMPLRPVFNHLLPPILRV